MSELTVYVLRLTYTDSRPEVPVQVVDTIVAAGTSVEAVVEEWISDYAMPTPRGEWWSPEPSVEVLGSTDTEGWDYDLIERSVDSELIDLTDLRSS